ncbi:F-box/kelch-repeat protein At3g23880-like [Apium graveolens]|uniref:F-box/kelch-repeat protein At3g23880-like n=1 Tax=Apium graveolens TaxID=4045 RepID=UPI003D79DE1B
MPRRIGAKRKKLTMEELLRVGGEKRRRLTRDHHQLPEEIIIDEILTLLPIKSVVRFKSVSKSWLSLISSSRFIKKHNICSSLQNPNDYDCFVADKEASRESHIAIVSRYKEIFKLPRDCYFLIGSVNGLVCLLRLPKRVSLWNPAIHQSIEFNLPQDKQGAYSRPTLIGLGFDPVSNDYKVVVCNPSSDSCDVYSSNSNSWIQLSVPHHEFIINKFKESSSVPTTYVKDCPYWTYSTYSADEIKYFTFLSYNSSYGTYRSVKNNFVISLTALKFDATSNKFKLLPEFFPDARSCESEKIFKFMNMRDLLTLLAFELSPTGKLDVYSLDEEKGCGVWIKMLQVGPFQQFENFQNLQQGFRYGDEIVFFESDKICYYDHKRDIVKCLPGKEAFTLKNCFTYTPSMVFLHGMKSIYADDQTRPLGHPIRLMNSLKG